MFAVTSLWLCWTLLSVSLVGFTCADHKNVTAESGHNVILTCRAPNNNIVVKWSRADLESEYVLLYRDDLSVPDDQHPSFKNRVDLQDRQMKDGDVSLILNNVTVNDTGTYVCRVFVRKTRSWKSISSINLHVDPPDQETITAQSGQDVTLTCRAPNNNLIVVEWSRPDLGEVFVYRNNHFDSDDQHPSFKNRVDLQDRQMKDGDVSVILKDAMINDTGTYECRVFMEGTNRGKRAHQTIDPISIIYLRVVDPSVQKNITAESGQKNATLTCRAPNNLLLLLLLCLFVF
ncbi:CD226 antigen-like [Simochromis diagramma]|uniref:CD226 antigen-like n=1 Tax=Simochromis diagramma TaxID=43689 RepID=UPI001A7EA86D|nr:CD226 antigen-like [Simochromis diagramma]